MIDFENLSRKRSRELILDFHNDLQSVMEPGYLPRSNEPELELVEQAGLATERIRELEGSIAVRSYSRSLRSTTAGLCKSQGWQFDELSMGRREDLLEGVARALAEQQKLFIVRLGSRLTPYVPSDPLFVRAVNCTDFGADFPGTIPVDTGPCVSQAIAAYLERGRKIWTAKTHAGRVRQLKYFEQHFGPDTSLAFITSGDVRAYRDGIKRLRSNHHRTIPGSFASRQTDNELHRITSKTASLMFESVKAFFRWAVEEEGYLQNNPSEHVRIETPKTKKGIKSRRPFTEEELAKLFTQPLFIGCSSANRRFQPGNLRIKDDYFWIPILAYYTGARLGELVQLHLGDVHLDQSVPFLDISETNGGEVGTPNAKHVKSAAGIRCVPIHDDVIQLGFHEFVASRKKAQKATARLFYRIPFGSDGQASTVFSKWFARFLGSGLVDQSQKMTVAARAMAERKTVGHRS